MTFIMTNICLSNCAERLCWASLYVPACFEIDALPILSQKDIKAEEKAEEEEERERERETSIQTERERERERSLKKLILSKKKVEFFKDFKKMSFIKSNICLSMCAVMLLK